MRFARDVCVQCDPYSRAAGLIVDYGRQSGVGDSIRGIRDHKFVCNILEDPGLVDLSANVDFSALRTAVEASGTATAHGPVTQSEFLQTLGITHRLEAIAAQQEDPSDEIDRVARLLHPDQMGSAYKALCITPSRAAPPVCFT